MDKGSSINPYIQTKKKTDLEIDAICKPRLHFKKSRTHTVSSEGSVTGSARKGSNPSIKGRPSRAVSNINVYEYLFYKNHLFKTIFFF